MCMCNPIAPKETTVVEENRIPKLAKTLMVATVGYIVLAIIIAGFNHIIFPKHGCFVDVLLFNKFYLLPPLLLIIVMLIYAVISLIRLKITQMAALLGVSVISALLLSIGRVFHTCVIVSV